jgi:hypothetical protein
VKHSFHLYSYLASWISVLILSGCAAFPTTISSDTSTPVPTAMPTSVQVPSQESEAVTSPPSTGQSIAVAFVQNGDLHVWEDGQTKTIFSAGDVVSVWMSDDGKLIAFTRRSIVQRNEDEWFEQSALWVVDATGSHPGELVSAEDLRQRLSAGESDSTDFAQVKWLPHAHHLVYSGIKYIVQGEGQSHALPEGVYLVDADKRSQAALAPAGNNYRLAPSPDGRQLALLSLTGIGFVDVDGANWRPDVLIYPKAGVPIPLLPSGVWTQDSHAFLAVAPIESESPSILSYVIWNVPVDGSPAEPLASLHDTHSASVTFSPDGQQAAFYRWQAGPPETFNWFITPLASSTGSLAIPNTISLEWANLHWSPTGVPYVIHEGTLSQLCPDATQDTDICGDPLELGENIDAIQWMDGTRFLFMTRDPYNLFLGSLDGIKIPIAESAQSFAAALIEQPAETPAPSDTPLESSAVSPASPTPTPELATGRMLTSTSPDGKWKAEALLASPCDFSGEFRSSILVFDLDSGTVRIVTDNDPQTTPLVIGWPEPDKLLVDRDGVYFLDLNSGTLQFDTISPDPISTL